jgi:hypothetical protein
MPVAVITATGQNQACGDAGQERWNSVHCSLPTSKRARRAMLV